MVWLLSLVKPSHRPRQYLGMPAVPNSHIDPVPERKKRIMIVDDDVSICEIFRLILTNAGYEVIIQTDPHSLLRQNILWPDLFLIDKQLPDLDGLDLCRHLKSQQQTSKIPVIMISAVTDISFLSKEAGADSCIEKPFEMSVLTETLRKFLGEGANSKKSLV